MVKNLYKILDINPSCTQLEITHAFEQAKKAYSSDSIASYSIVDDSEKVNIIDDITFAYEILSNPSKRKKYDQKKENFSEIKKKNKSKSKKVVQIKSSPSKKTVQANNNFSQGLSPEEFNSNPQFENEINKCQEINGEFLTTVRVYRRLSLQQLSSMTKISVKNIEKIESEDIDSSYHGAYLMGHLRLICKELNIPNGFKLAKEYTQKLKSAGKLS